MFFHYVSVATEILRAKNTHYSGYNATSENECILFIMKLGDLGDDENQPFADDGGMHDGRCLCPGV
jgi:hypothetical protein